MLHSDLFTSCCIINLSDARGCMVGSSSKKKRFENCLLLDVAISLNWIRDRRLFVGLEGDHDEQIIED